MATRVSCITDKFLNTAESSETDHFKLLLQIKLFIANSKMPLYQVKANNRILVMDIK